MLSIILPVYNTQNYLSRCIKSIISQNYKDWELIIVNDGSTDKSPIICEEFASNDKRIKVINKSNGGVSSARNIGLDNSKGEWVYFCDSDDKLSGENSLKDLVSLTSGSQLAVEGLMDADEQGNIIGSEEETSTFKGWLTKKEYVSRFFDKKRSLDYQGFLPTKLFQREIIEKSHLRFDTNIKFAEDMLFVTEYCCCKEVKTVNIDLNKKIYCYIHHKGSAMESLKESYNPNFFTDFLAFEKIYHKVKATFDDKKLNKMFLRRLFVSGSWILDMMNRFNADYKEQREYIERVMSKHPRLKEEFDTSHSLSLMIRKAKSLPIDERIRIVNNWLHSKNCHFSALTMNWKAAYILSIIGGETGIKLIKNKLDFQ